MQSRRAIRGRVIIESGASAAIAVDQHGSEALDFNRARQSIRHRHHRDGNIDIRDLVERSVPELVGDQGDARRREIGAAQRQQRHVPVWGVWEMAGTYPCCHGAGESPCARYCIQAAENTTLDRSCSAQPRAHPTFRDHRPIESSRNDTRQEAVKTFTESSRETYES
jgi:hypothetical protein